MRSNAGYLKGLGMNAEPFGMDADPSMLYLSEQHSACIEKLEMAIRMKRGLAILSGDIGTGKTSVSGRLARILGDESFSVKTISDPDFESPATLRRCVFRLFTGKTAPATTAAWSMKDALRTLFLSMAKKGVTPVLFVDEAQKMTDQGSLSVMQELVNMVDKDGGKLVQVVLIGQNELESVVGTSKALFDRIAAKAKLGKMVLFETRDMLRFRLESVGCRDPKSFMPDSSCKIIHEAAGGSPRTAVKIAHQCLVRTVNEDGVSIGPALVKKILKEEFSDKCDVGRTRDFPHMGKVMAIAAAVIIAVAVALGLAARYSGSVPDAPAAEAAAKTAPSEAAARGTKGMGAESVVPAPAQDGKTENGARSVGGPETTATSGTPGKTDAVAISRIAPESAAASVGEPVTETSPQNTLGFILTGNDDTLSSVMAGVYGTYRRAMVKAVMDANPFLVDPDQLPPGRMLFLPPIESASDWTGKTVSGQSFKTLGDAWFSLGKNPKGKRILVVKTRSGLRFLVVRRDGSSEKGDMSVKIGKDDKVYGV